ncbi:MAG: GatB/YqeY domain-containing protein [Patescibacteria group bacterium]
MAKTDVISLDLVQAMKAKDGLKVSTLRMLVAALKNSQIAKGGVLTDQEAEAVLGKEAKKRQEAIELYQQGNRQELVDKETTELNLIKGYLPEAMSEVEIKAIVEEVLSTVPERNFGMVMKAVMAKTQGKADGKMVAKLVQEAL